MKGIYRVLGAKGFKGTVDGQSFDSTKLYVELPVSERAGTEVGYNAAPVPFGKADEFEKLKGLPFPIKAELDLEMTTKGMECHAFKAISQAQDVAK